MSDNGRNSAKRPQGGPGPGRRGGGTMPWKVPDGKNSLAAPLLHRLSFGEEKLRQVTEGLKATASLEDPLGHTLYAKEITEGLRLYRVTCPIGVIGYMSP